MQDEYIMYLKEKAVNGKSLVTLTINGGQNEGAWHNVKQKLLFDTVFEALMNSVRRVWYSF